MKIEEVVKKVIRQNQMDPAIERVVWSSNSSDNLNNNSRNDLPADVTTRKMPTPTSSISDGMTSEEMNMRAKVFD